MTARNRSPWRSRTWWRSGTRPPRADTAPASPERTPALRSGHHGTRAGSRQPPGRHGVAGQGCPTALDRPVPVRRTSPRLAAVSPQTAGTGRGDHARHVLVDRGHRNRRLQVAGPHPQFGHELSNQVGSQVITRHRGLLVARCSSPRARPGSPNSDARSASRTRARRPRRPDHRHRCRTRHALPPE